MSYTLITANPLGTSTTYLCRTPGEVARKEEFLDRFGIGYEMEVF